MKNKFNNPPKCPYCNKALDMYECVEEPQATPDNGDFSVCSNCAGISVFKKNEDQISLRECTDADQERCQNWDKILEVHQRIKLVVTILDRMTNVL